MAFHDEFKAVDTKGNTVKLNAFTKNKMYKDAKRMKGEMRERMCTKSECWLPNRKNVEKMTKNEMTGQTPMAAYKKIMGNIGADPKDCGTEQFRKRG